MSEEDVVRSPENEEIAACPVALVGVRSRWHTVLIVKYVSVCIASFFSTDYTRRLHLLLYPASAAPKSDL
jgi:hypothetical protein